MAFLFRLEDVSTVIVGTCQMQPKTHRDVFDSMQFDILSPKQVLMHSFHSGSSAEFYIKPINSCIDDIDHMQFKTNSMAFVEDIPVLPDDLRGLFDKIDCFKIMPNPDYPGFVELKHLGEMKYNWHYKKFQFHKTNKLQNLVANRNPLILFYHEINDIKDPEMVGPAIKTISDNSDAVPCYWCPQWPKEAQNWPFRRNNGWPTTDVIRKVVQNGCHVVFAKHPACRNDRHQWRLSFSAAELCLLRSWTPVQQIVYHMLRFFAKREIIKKDCAKEDEVLCTYHLKTLVLWACEEMSPEWWNVSPVVEICFNLFRKLSEWLKRRYCPNYFIPQANLLHEGMNQKLIDVSIGRLSEFRHTNSLSAWFAVNYIKPILERVLTFEDTMKPVIDVGYCMLRICEIIDADKLAKFDYEFSSGFWFSVRHIYPKHNYLERGYVFHTFIGAVCCMGDHEIKKVDQDLFLSTVEFSSKFPQFVKVLFILIAANELEFKQTTYESELFTEFIREVSWQPKVLRCKYHNFPKPSKTSLETSQALFLKAQDLMENLTELNSPQEFKLLSQLSKLLLRNAIYCDDLKSSAIRSVALVYMAALHFSESDYETAMDLSSTDFYTQTPSHDDDKYNGEEEIEEDGNTETLNARCLSYVDYVVRSIGFYLLFRRIRLNFQYNYRRHYLLKLCLTTEVFSHYLIVPSNERRHKDNRINYEVKGPKSDFPESHPEIVIDLSLTIVNTQIPRYNDDKDNDEKGVEDKQKEKEKHNARGLILLSESIFTIAIDLSSNIFINHPPFHCEKAKETLNAGCLLYIDDVAAIIGFYLIIRRIQDNFQYNGRRYLIDLRLSPQVFAHYLITSSIERRSKDFRQNYDFQPSAYPMDKILTTVTNRKSAVLSKSAGSAVRAYQRTDLSNQSEEPNRSSDANEFDIIQLLMEYSLETMNSFYDVICKDFNIRCNTVDCYRAAYLYQCRKYSEVLDLCDVILGEPDLKQNLERFTFANVMVMPPLDSYFDRDIQCLLGLHTLVCYLSPLNEDLCKLQYTAESKFQHFLRQIFTLRNVHFLHF